MSPSNSPFLSLFRPVASLSRLNPEREESRWKEGREGEERAIWVTIASSPSSLLHVPHFHLIIRSTISLPIMRLLLSSPCNCPSLAFLSTPHQLSLSFPSFFHGHLLLFRSSSQHVRPIWPSILSDIIQKSTKSSFRRYDIPDSSRYGIVALLWSNWFIQPNTTPATSSSPATSSTQQVSRTDHSPYRSGVFHLRKTVWNDGKNVICSTLPVLCPIRTPRKIMCSFCQLISFSSLQVRWLSIISPINLNIISCSQWLRIWDSR